MLSAFIRTFKCQKIFIIGSSNLKRNSVPYGPFETDMGWGPPLIAQTKKNIGRRHIDLPPGKQSSFIYPLVQQILEFRTSVTLRNTF